MLIRQIFAQRKDREMFMKNKFPTGRKIISLLLAFAMSSSMVVLAQTEDKTFVAASDTYTSSLNTAKAYSVEPKIVVSADEDDVRKGFIGFNVGKLRIADDTRITLRLMPVKVTYGVPDESGANKGVVSVWGLKAHNWKQSEVTGKKMPAAGAAIASFDELTEGQLCEVDVTEYVKSNMSAEGYISFMIAEDADTGSVFEFASKEAKSGRAELFVDYDYVAPPQEDVPEATKAPSNVTVKDYNEIFTTGELKHTNHDPVVTTRPHLEYPTLEEYGIPEDIYIEEFTTVRVNKHLVNYTFGEPKTLGTMHRGQERAQMVYAIAISPTNLNKILIGSDCQIIYSSVDGGKTSFVSAENIGSNGINYLTYYPADDNIAFALVSTTNQAINSGAYKKGSGVYKSTDSGKTWERKDCDIISGLVNAVPSLMVWGSPMENGVLPLYVAGNNNSGIWRSYDVGETWECIYEGVSSNHIEARGEMIIVSTGSDIIVSYDRGDTWESAAGSLKGLTCESTTVDPANTDHWIAGTKDPNISGWNCNIWETFDKGKTWTYIACRDDLKINNFWGVKYGPLDKKTNSARLYLMGNQNQYVHRYSDDHGRTWVRPIYYQSDTYTTITGGYWMVPLAFCEGYPDVVISGLENVALSYDRGTTFHNVAYARSGARASQFWFDPDEPGHMYISHIDTAIRKTIPQGDEWYPITYGEPMWSGDCFNMHTNYGVLVDPTNKDRVIIAQGNWTGQHTMYESLDGGLNYKYKPEHTLYAITPYWHAQDPNVIYAGNERSDDGGRTWKSIPMVINAVAPSNNDIVYSQSNNTVYMSEDRGETWTRVVQRVQGTDNGKEIRVDMDDPYRIYVGTNQTNLWIINTKTGEMKNKTESSGLVRTSIIGQNISIEGIAQNPRNHDHIIVGGRGFVNAEPTPGIYESFDRGETFRLIKMPPPADIWEIEFHPTRPQVFIATSGGTFVYEYENYDKQRPESYFTDTEGTFCEDEVLYLVENEYIGEKALYDFAKGFEFGIDRYMFEGDFLTLALETTDCVSEHVEPVFNDIPWDFRYFSQVQRGIENGLVLKSDGDENGNLNLKWKKLTMGKCANYLVRLLGMNGINTDVSSAEINKYLKDGVTPNEAHSLAVLYKYGILTGDDGFEFSPERVITRGEIAYMLARTLKQYE